MERPAEPLPRHERGEVPSGKQTADLRENVAPPLVRFRPGVQETGSSPALWLVKPLVLQLQLERRRKETGSGLFGSEGLPLEGRNLCQQQIWQGKQNRY